MITFKAFIKESLVSRTELNNLESELDKLFANIGMDIEFTGHFLDRTNDSRNKKQITIGELRAMFKKSYDRYKDKFGTFKDGYEAVLLDFNNNINIPFVLKYDKKNNELDLISKTIMRTKNFKTRNKKLKV